VKQALHKRFAAVCLPVPVDVEFTYAVPERLRDGLAPGRRVRVPFGPRAMAGWCVGFADEPETKPDGKGVETKEVQALLDDGPLVDDELLSLSRWIADTYACSWGEALSACVPGGVRSETAEATVLVARLAASREAAESEALRCAEKHVKRSRVLRVLLEHPDGLAVRDLVRAAQCGDSPVRTLAKAGLVELIDRRVDVDPFAGAEPEPPADVELTAEQEHAVARVSAALAARRARTLLLLGVTGSGKTEVYLRSIRRCVDEGRQAVVLVPEIALTPQTVARFRGWFDRVAVLHSALTDAERRRQWTSIRAGAADVVIGPRSAVFAPVPRLGLVVVDEEHEPTFKQQSQPRYHARDAALERARRAGAVVLLGSATPSLESAHAAQTGEYELLRLPARVGASLPRVEIVDLHREETETKRPSLLSRRLVELMRRALAEGNQSILFLNRRGFATSLYCGRCDAGVSCPRCSVSMTLHRSRGTVLCHHCGRESPPPRQCPGCGAPGIARLGAGTERLEDVLRAVFPGARTARMDSDAMHGRESYERVLSAFGRGEIDVLVGTQMIAKGLHFPRVTVVGVIAADVGLSLPDFRAAERTFQLVAQVAGRAGRAGSAGRVVVQTHQPRHASLLRAAEHDFDGFAAAELLERRRHGWPPYSRLVRAVTTARDESAARERCGEIVAALVAALPPGAADVLGPAPCSVVRVKDRYRWHCVVKAADLPVRHAAVLRLARFARRAAGTETTVDVDPVDLS
jgi:primosomal protein N' (replication factor Y)